MRSLAVLRARVRSSCRTLGRCRCGAGGRPAIAGERVLLFPGLRHHPASPGEIAGGSLPSRGVDGGRVRPLRMESAARGATADAGGRHRAVVCADSAGLRAVEGLHDVGQLGCAIDFVAHCASEPAASGHALQRARLGRRRRGGQLGGDRAARAAPSYERVPIGARRLDQLGATSRQRPDLLGAGVRDGGGASHTGLPSWPDRLREAPRVVTAGVWRGPLRQLAVQFRCEGGDGGSVEAGFACPVAAEQVGKVEALGLPCEGDQRRHGV
mmetsp:Transcript_86087/g.248570  ORF Transcript_86087/g.248570 Transcript_86087/m.248570 type:complete len:269 (+) Transcript_86087:401-1207(+)